MSQDPPLARSQGVIGLSVATRCDRAEASHLDVVETDFEQSFRAVFDDRFMALRRYLDRMTGDPDLAADVAQETFVRLFQRGAMPEDVRAWLAAVASNLFRDERRRTRRRAALLAGQPPELTMASRAPHPDDHATASDERRRVRAALDALPLRERQLLLLRFEDYSYRELAVAVGVAESGVGTLLMRAMRAFRAALATVDSRGGGRR